MNRSCYSFARLTLVAAALTLGVVAASAQEGGFRQSTPARGLDGSPVAAQSSDAGIIKEINAQQFEAIDRDHDNYVNLAEFMSSPILRGDVIAAATGQAPTVAAPRSDGSVLIKPAPGRNTPELFRQLDKDRDGFLDSIEIAAFYVGELEG